MATQNGSDTTFTVSATDLLLAKDYQRFMNAEKLESACVIALSIHDFDLKVSMFLEIITRIHSLTKNIETDDPSFNYIAEEYLCMIFALQPAITSHQTLFPENNRLLYELGKELLDDYPELTLRITDIIQNPLYISSLYLALSKTTEGEKKLDYLQAGLKEINDFQEWTGTLQETSPELTRFSTKLTKCKSVLKAAYTKTKTLLEKELNHSDTDSLPEIPDTSSDDELPETPRSD